MQLPISKIFKLVLSSFILFFSAVVMAAQNSPVGYWKILDESTQQPTSIVQITNKQGALTGKVVKLFNNPDAVCTKCSGDQHNKPVLGMTILWGFSPAQDGSFTGGKVLALKRGSVFDADIQLAADGQTLDVIVKAGFGDHKQVWQRASGVEG